jgi:hypothetical protein
MIFDIISWLVLVESFRKLSSLTKNTTIELNRTLMTIHLIAYFLYIIVFLEFTIVVSEMYYA